MAKLHAILSASASHRWMTCPGSIRLIAELRQAGLIAADVSTPYSIEGQAAHELGERCMRAGVDADTLIGHWMLTESDTPVQVTEEMAEAVQVYLDYCRSISVEDGDSLYFIESTFDLSLFHPGLFGTSDCVVLHRPTQTLYVIDYKHGIGVPVEAIGNPQLRYYGLGGLVRMRELRLPPPYPARVKLVVVQPRSPHRAGPVREDTMDVGSLLAWSERLVDAARATEDASAPLRDGPHCRDTFCPAQARCPKLQATSLQAAQVAFKKLGDQTVLEGPKPPAQMTHPEIQRALQAAVVIEPWIKELYAHAAAMIERGDNVPGWKMVQKRAQRSWAQSDALMESFLMRLGLPREQCWEPPAIRSPAQIEKVLPKKQHIELDPVIARVSSGLTLVPDSDPRPAVKVGLPFHPLAVESKS